MLNTVFLKIKVFILLNSVESNAERLDRCIREANWSVGAYLIAFGNLLAYLYRRVVIKVFREDMKHYKGCNMLLLNIIEGVVLLLLNFVLVPLSVKVLWYIVLFIAYVVYRLLRSIETYCCTINQ